VALRILRSVSLGLFPARPHLCSRFFSAVFLHCLRACLVHGAPGDMKHRATSQPKPKVPPFFLPPPLRVLFSICFPWTLCKFCRCVWDPASSRFERIKSSETLGPIFVLFLFPLRRPVRTLPLSVISSCNSQWLLQRPICCFQSYCSLVHGHPGISLILIAVCSLLLGLTPWQCDLFCLLRPVLCSDQIRMRVRYFGKFTVLPPPVFRPCLPADALPIFSKKLLSGS